MKVADLKFQKKLLKTNNFRPSVTDNSQLKRLDSDEEIFDPGAAQTKVLSDENQINLNPLFLNTKAFDVSTKEYTQFKDAHKKRLDKEDSERKDRQRELVDQMTGMPRGLASEFKPRKTTKFTKNIEDILDPAILEKK